MKLSVEKKFGWIHCRGGRLLQVVHEHQVSVKGLNQLTMPDKDGVVHTRKLEHDVTAMAGDLAIEIIGRKQKKILGYSFLSGAAVQLNDYTIRPDRFEAAVLRRAELVPPTTEEVATEEGFLAYQARFYEHCVAMKISQDVDVWALEASFTDGDSVESLGRLLTDAFRYVTKDMNSGDKQELKLRSHFVAAIHGGRGKTGRHLHMHLQPPKHAGPFCSTPFQSALLTTSLEHAEDEGPGLEAS